MPSKRALTQAAMMSSSRRSRPAVIVLKHVFIVSHFLSETEMLAIDAFEQRDVCERVAAGRAERLASA